MPDYVYGLHDFEPEHEDEVPFKQGEPIEVIEKDDLYSDGWWQGRNVQGRVGLFPQSYTTTTAPTADFSSSPSAPTPAPPNLFYTPSEASASANGGGDGEVMKATMTDVQKAIEQLGRNHGTSFVQEDDHDARSFSFASTRTGGEDFTDTDFDMDADEERDDGEWVGSGDHKDARMKLAEKARKVVEKQKKEREEEERAVELERSVAPPIEVELSDESEGEDDEDNTHHTHLPKTPALSTISESAPEPSALGLPTPPSSSIGGQHMSKDNSPVSEKDTPKENDTPKEKGAPKEKEAKKTHPTEWSVEEVVDWLKSKGFADDVTDKFIEQEITGDVLLDLDVNLLKSEIGIPAFGKRMRIANAITDLRRPPSVIYSDHAVSQTHSRAQSQSVQSSPIFPGGGAQYSPGGPLTSAGFGTIMSIETPPYTGDLTPETPRDQRRISDPISNASMSVSVTDADEGIPRNGAVGTGLGVGLGVAAAAGMGTVGKNNSISKPDDASVVSRHSRTKRSIDGSKSADRFSLLGGAFNGSIGKSRKPAPRYGDGEAPAEKHSSMSLSRLYGGNSRKNSGRSSADKQQTGSSHSGSPTEASSPKRDTKVYSTEKDSRYEKEKDIKDSNPTVLRKRTSANDDGVPARGMQALKPGQSILQQIGQPDHVGWMRKKGDRYNSWKQRYFVLKGPHLYILKSESMSETKIKGYVNIIGYKVLADENTDPGRYGFRIVHDIDKTHFFSSSEQIVIREWMKAIMKATIGRDYSKAVVSSCNIPTIPLTVAQAMSPAPRPPSPTARAAAQKAHRLENLDQLTTRDARVLMGLPGPENGDRPGLDAVFEGFESKQTATGIPSPASYQQPRSPAPPRPSREMRSSITSEINVNSDAQLIAWANSHLPKKLQITDPNGPLCGGLALLRLAESIRGKPSSPPVPDSAFPSGPNDDKLDGLFKLFDFLLDNDVKTGSVSINEVRQGRREKIVQLMRALKAWDDKRQAIQQSIAKGGPSIAGSPGMSPFANPWGQVS